jgi:hypothetical protein
MKSVFDFLRGRGNPPSLSGGTNEKGSLREEMHSSVGKNVEDEAGIHGQMHIEHVRDGNVITTIETPNYIVDAGLNEVAALISTSGTGSKFSAIAVGTNSAATAATQTALSGESHRVVFADAISAQTATFTSTFSFTGDFTIQEAGIFNHTTTAGDMLSRRIFNAINVANGDSLVITWSITVNRS